MIRTTITHLVKAALVATVLTGTAQAADYNLKFGHLANEDNVWHKAAMKFAEEVNTLSDGRIEVQVFPNEQLGKEIDLINGIQLGTVDMTITGESLQNWAQKAALLAIPYALRDLDHLDAVASGEIGDEIEAQITETTQLRPIAYFARGPRNLTSNRPIKSPDELNGLRLRVPNVPLFVSVWETLGAKPTPMAFSEVFTSLQSGTIDAQENPLSLIKSASFYEVQENVNLTEHVRSWIYVVIGENQFSSMPEDLQQAVTEAAGRMQEYERELFLAEEQQLVDDLKEQGMEFVEVDKQAFVDKAKPAVLDALDDDLEPLFEKMLSTQ